MILCVPCYPYLIIAIFGKMAFYVILTVNIIQFIAYKMYFIVITMPEFLLRFNMVVVFVSWPTWYKYTFLFTITF
jgi:hypothetical protein